MKRSDWAGSGALESLIEGSYVSGEKLVAVYARLSVNESGERDSCLETQCGLLSDFVCEKGLGQARLYIDNDESGVYFDRPGLLRLAGDIRGGVVRVVVIKDLSRLGRNDGETLVFLDFLKEHNVRLISLGDGYDSFEDDDEIIGIRTWVNEHYARDISKKVRANLKRKMRSGEYLGRPHFGYLKSGCEKNRLVVDERYRKVIQEIFDLYICGMGYRALAAHVQALGIPTPSQDKNYAGARQSARWNGQHIRRIITSGVYCGDTVQGVSEKVSFKSRKTRRLPPEKWVVVENTHEAVISRETFELAQQVRSKRRFEGEGRKKKVESGIHFFSGFLICASCGSHLVYKKKEGRPARYVCGKYNRFGRKGSGCASHYVREDELAGFLVEDVGKMAGGVAFQERLAEEYRRNVQLSVDKTATELKRLEAGIAGKKRRQKAVYLDKIKGVISAELFDGANSEMERELSILMAKAARLEEELDSAGRMEEDIRKIKDMELRVDTSDIDRFFLEKYVQKIIVVEEWEAVDQIVRGKYCLDSLLTGKQKTRLAGGKARLIIIYNFSP